ncbi:MAG: SPOR domain-containing protein [Alphaproteobacteria bacterium]|nr:SPOR domain-containing protein [Alphaproteobacteria bacterium]
MRKSLALIGLPILLGGCGLPPAVSVASWALDGVSYLVSGKSVTDHAISEVAQQDCALLRIVQGRTMCEEFSDDGGDGPIFTASALSEAGHSGPVVTDPFDPRALTGGPVNSFAPSANPVAAVPELAEIAQAFGPNATNAAAIDIEPLEPLPATSDWTPPAPTGDPGASDGAVGPDAPVAPVGLGVEAAIEREVLSPARAPSRNSEESQTARAYVAVVGSFSNPGNARGLADKLAYLGAEIRIFEAGGRTWHRVVAPASLDEVQQAGFSDAWLLRICDAAETGGGSCATWQPRAEAGKLQVAAAN